MEPNQLTNEHTTQHDNEHSSSWMNEVDKICKKAMQSLENTHEITVNIGKSAINCLDELNNQSDTICRINQMVNTAIGSLSDTAKCLKDMASPVTSIISGMYDEYVVPNVNSSQVSTGTDTENNRGNIDASTKEDISINMKNNIVIFDEKECKADKNAGPDQEIQGDGILANFSRTSCNKLDQIIDQLQFNKGATEELVKSFYEDKQKLIDTVDNVKNLQDNLAKVQSAMSNM